MAARLPPIQEPISGAAGVVTPAWHRFFQDMPNRLGGDADLSVSADATSLTFTLRLPDGTLLTKVLAW
jgi:hypothetical protein